jgi:AMMECR1 domain-containing protein
MERGRRIRYLGAALIALAAVTAFNSQSYPADDPLLSKWSEFSKKPESKILMQWLRRQAQSRLIGTQCEGRLEVKAPDFFGKLGVFITLQKKKKVRGCFGSFSHGTADIELLLRDYLTGALTRDPRHDPLDIFEFTDTEIIMTVTSAPFAIDDPGSVDLRHCGIVLACSGEDEVFVPAEIRSLSYFEKIIRGKTCQYSAFEAVTIR